MKIFLHCFILLTVIISISPQCADGSYKKECPPTTSPVWPDQFEQTFEETFTYPILGSDKTKGKFFYDWVNKKYRVDIDNGHYDRYCGTIYKFSKTPCSHIVTSGKRYLYFPEKDYCCYCCGSEHGCGILKPDWLSDSQFVDYVEENGVMFEKWDKKGLQHNYYYATAKDRVMRKIDQQPNDVQDFDVDSFYKGIKDENVFNLPAKCDPNFTCPLLSICTAVRKSAALKFLTQK
jgi:hypothetical protein